MSAQHHLDEATLLRYASGDLDEAFSVVVASHLAMCLTCRRAAQEAEQVGGRFLESMDKSEMATGAFDRLMQRLDLDEDTIVLDREMTANGANGDVPLPLRRYVGDSVAGISWNTISPGVRRHAINLSSPTHSSLYMLHIAPGKAVPEHGHGGAELTLVLSGAYRDELGLFGPGDIADLDEHV